MQVAAWQPRVRGMSSSARREELEGYLCISPWLLGLLIFTIGPILASLYLSFTEYEVVKPPVFTGLANYVMLARDDLFWQSLKVTSIYTFVSVPLRITLSFAIALLMNQQVKFLGLFRTAYYMPNLVPAVASAILWVWIFQPQFGLLNGFLRGMGIENPPPWLGSTKWALPSLILMSLWGVGGPMLIYLAGLQGIPTEMYEAAEIDGAGRVSRFRHVTLPQMSPVVFFNLIMSIIGSFQVFAAGYIMTGGGPRYATYFYVLYLYNNAFSFFRMGYASALAWILAIIILFFTVLVFRSSAAWVYYSGELKGRA
ncbi:MAG: sugar ABC transporter permease [Anaerolineae bacterium]|nr:sugar ABC transporter permease [Anaerolineae bacterium]